MANRRDILLKILADGTDGEQEIDNFKRKLKDFDGTEAEARISLRREAIEAQIDKIRKRLENFSKQEYTPEVAIKMARAVEQIDRLELKLDKLDHKDVTVSVDVDRSGLDRIGQLFSSLGDRSGNFGGGFFSRSLGNLGQGIFGGIGALMQGLAQLPQVLSTATQAVSGFFQQFSTGAGAAEAVAQLLAAVGTGLITIVTTGGAALIALAALGAALNAILGVVTALLGALGALAASLVFAAAGAGALAVAFGAILGPAVLVVLGFMQRFAAVLQARKAHEQELTQALQQQKAAEDQRRQALDQVRQAEEQLSQATVAGREAAAQAIRDERDAQLALEDSQLGVKGARLAVLDAKKALQDLLHQAGVAGPALNALVKKFSDVDFDPSKAGRALGDVRGAGGDKKVDPLALAHAILAVQQAQQGVKDAVNQTANAEQRLQQAQKTRADFAARGLRAYAPYRQALQQVSKAEEGLAKAQDKVTAGQAKYQEALSNLSGPERGFLGALDDFIKKLEDLAKLIAQPIFAGLEKAMGSLGEIASDPGVRSGLTAIGQAIGGFIAQFARTISTRGWRDALASFAQDAARFIGQAGTAFINLSKILLEIARTAMPELLALVKGLSSWLGRIAGQPGAIHRAVSFVVGQFKDWLGIAGHLAGIVLGFLKGATGSAKSLSGHIDHLLGGWDNWINSKKGQQDVRRFLDHAVTQTTSIFKTLGQWIPELSKILGFLSRIVDLFDKAAAFLGGGQSKLELQTGAAARDLDSLNREVVNLQNDTTASQKSATRQRIRDLLSDLKSMGYTVPIELLARLKQLGFAAGGYTGDGPSGSIAGFVHAREYVLPEAIKNAIGVPRLDALRAGVAPELVFAGAAGAGSTTTIARQHVGDRHTHFHIDAGSRSVDDLMDEMYREISRGGGAAD